MTGLQHYSAETLQQAFELAMAFELKRLQQDRACQGFQGSHGCLRSLVRAPLGKRTNTVDAT